MSSYDEHLITQAGGDGDMLDQIQRRAVSVSSVIGNGDAMGPRFCDKAFNLAEHDVPALLALVREQQARIERVRKLAESAAPLQGMGGMYSGIVLAEHVLTALEPTP